MIAVDTSALMAIVLREPERAGFLAALEAADDLAISAGTLVETRMVCFSRGGPVLVAEVDALIDALGINVRPPGENELAVAHTGFVQFGKGNGHPAQLNFGDLFAYALAKSNDAPLLFKGDDFAASDVTSALQI